MSESKAARLAAIRAANAQKRAADGLTSPAVPAPEGGAAHPVVPAEHISRATAAPPPAVIPVVAAVGADQAPRAAHTKDTPGGTPPPVVPVTSATIRLPREPGVTPAGRGDDARPPRAAAPAARGTPPAPVPEATLSAPSLGLLLLAAVGGAFLAAFALPAWLPGLTASLLGPEPKAYWYLSRSTAFVAYGLLWLSMALGLMMTNKLARLWPGGPVAFDLHEHASILGLAFGLFHALILLGDRYAGYTLGQILVPFASGGAAPLWVGLGQVGLYLMGLVGLSFYLRPLIGRAGWRLIHFLSFVVFGLVLVHGVQSGSDTDTAWAQALYWLSGGSLLFLTVYRVLGSVTKPAPAPRQAPPTAAARERLGAA